MALPLGPRRRAAAARDVVLLLCLLPLARLIWGVASDSLGANPVEAVTRQTGWWALCLLCATLAVTPLRRWTGANDLQRLRRPLGLYAFLYASLHVLAYISLDAWFDIGSVLRDVVKRPFITVGFAAFVLLLPPALTSSNAAKKRLGRRWRPVHRLGYAAAALGVLHFAWLVKRDLGEPLQFALVLGILLGVRLWWWTRASAGGSGSTGVAQTRRMT